MRARLRTWLRSFWRRDAWEADLRLELANHVSERAADLVRRGMTPEEARRRARIELGSAERYREEARTETGFRLIDETRQDLRYAYRGMRRAPLFVLVAVVSIALGVGVNTVVFSIVNSLILRPLPIADPERVRLIEPNKFMTFSFPNFRDVRDRNTTFAGMAGYRPAALNVSADGRTEQLWGQLVTGNYFSLLGVVPSAGRFFTAAEDVGEGGAPYAVLAYSTWVRRFGADPSAVGRRIQINGRSYTVLGVAPRGFFGTETVFRPELYLPMSMQGVVQGRSFLESRDTWDTFVIGRLAPAVTREAALADLGAIAAALAREFPRDNEGLELSITPPGLFGAKARSGVAAFAAGVLALAVLVLIAACANLASLFAARVSDRGRELAVRLSIGAGRARVARQLITEAIAVALIGGAVGWVAARWLLGRLTDWRPPGMPMQVDVDPDIRVFMIAFAATMIAGVISALAPARLATSVDLNRVLRGMPASGRPGRRWTSREALLAAQVGLAALLVTTCLVAVRGLSRSLEMPVGIDDRDVSLVTFDLTSEGRSQETSRVFQRSAVAAVAAIPGVAAAAYGSAVPLSVYASHGTNFRRDNAALKLTEEIVATEYCVSPGYLSVMGIRLTDGRDFTSTDDGDRLVAIVNHRFARLALDPGDPVGQQFRRGDGKLVEVVGVVEDGKYETLTEAPRAAVFWPAAQYFVPQTFVVARAAHPGTAIASRMEEAIRGLDPNLPLTNVGPVRELLAFAFLPSRIAAVALSAFGGLALLLAITGINGMAAYAVSQRTREIGIRMALGARPPTVLRLVFGRTALILGLGSVVGIALALGAGRLLAGVVAGAVPGEPLVLGAAGLAMVAAGMLAAAVPAYRATAIDPLRAVKGE
jgi:predicted permease